MDNPGLDKENNSSSSKSFPFIVSTDQSKPDKKTRKLVKQHVMRDIALARRKGNKNFRSPHIQIPLVVPEINGGDWLPLASEPKIDNQEVNQIVERILAPSPSLERLGAGIFDPILPYPIEMDHTSRGLIDNVFDTRMNTMKPYRDAFFHIAIHDRSAFFQLLANTELLRNSQKAYESDGKAQISYTAAKYHAKAIKLANSRLPNSEDAVSDGIISTVLIMAVYNHILQDFKSWNIHMSGLKRILELRGGIETLQTTPILRLLISWHDISGSYAHDQEPHFPYPIISLPTLPTPDVPPLAPVQHLINTFSSSSYTAVAQNLLTFHSYHEILRYENNWPEGRLISDKVVSGFWMNRIIQILLCLKGPMYSPNSFLEGVEETGNSTKELDLQTLAEIWRLGALLYLAEIRRRMGTWPVRTEVYVSKVQRIFRRYDVSNSQVWRGVGVLKLWVLVLAIFEARNVGERSLLIEDLRSVMCHEHLSSYEELRSALHGMFWDGSIFDEKLKDFWEKSWAQSRDS
ncbi:hypothetical protein HYALB_00007936 [Hymenoscyphus albidus]|uniref:Uncharacterized protein n=1 Tax=Hymenoscyphus albidus TaxID=595503 RepID=A0A9N9LKU5_9HELO|nr:hypothetical protein HYALB_00007936 [Hymenoscyphus albidus]